MTLCRISKLEIQGFRSFGRNAQTLEFPSPLAAVWGPNSQGKTSLAEAVEFLLTGQIVRRVLMASSSQDEFADALRNAHLPAGTPCFVQAAVIDADGSPHTIKRTLKTDYGKKQDCETILEIDGTVVPESGIAALGIVLSQPPLRAPVLAQHTLGYLFSARPQDRAGYFNRDARNSHSSGVPELRRFLEFKHCADRATGQGDRRTVAGRERAVAQSRTRTTADCRGWTDRLRSVRQRREGPRAAHGYEPTREAAMAAFAKS
jgi:hypothetical protein